MTMRRGAGDPVDEVDGIRVRAPARIRSGPGRLLGFLGPLAVAGLAW